MFFGESFSQNNPIWQKPKYLPVRITNRPAAGGGDSGPQSTITFTTIAINAVDNVYKPFSGMDQWHTDNTVKMPNAGFQSIRNDVYFRSNYSWNRFEPTQDNYDFSLLGADINDAIDNGQGFAFGAPIVVYTDAPGGYYVTFGNGVAAYPSYLHTLMQGEAVKDWKTDGNGPAPSCNGCLWIPNWNSTNFINRFGKLMRALANYLNVTSHNGVLYKDVITTVDIRCYGNYGEWHMGGVVSTMANIPTGARITVQTQKQIIDTMMVCFPNNYLNAMIACFDCHRIGSIVDNDQELAWYVLSRSPKISWRRDSYGDGQSFYSDYLENNTNTYNGMRFDSAIMNRYKYTPINGEPNTGFPMTNLAQEARLYHNNSVGNGNYNVTLTSAAEDTIRLAAKLMGNRVSISSGTASTTIIKGQQFSVTLNWVNSGLCPPYYPWTVTYSLRNAVNAEVYSSTSTMTLKYFQPSASTTAITDFITIPTSVSSGTYTLRLVMKDPIGYRAPFAIYNSVPGRQPDGSYVLISSLVL